MAGDLYGRMGKGHPSLSFYAKRKVHFLGPHGEKEWDAHLVASGKKMLILQRLFAPLQRAAVVKDRTLCGK